MSSKWICVYDRLPEEGKEVLCYYGDDITPDWTIDKLVNNCWEWYGDEDSLPTHWMELPEAPVDE
jgi:hypothetical protein